MITSEVPEIITEERGYNPPLGLMYVGAYAEKYTDHKVEILDTQVDGINYDGLRKEIKKRSPHIVGIQAMTFTLIDAILVAKITRNIDDDIKVVLGGPHVNIFPEDTIQIPEVDFIVLGEGEIPFTELIQSLDGGGDLRSVKGIVFKDNGGTVNTGPRDLIENLDSIPFPARHLTNYKKYSSLLSTRSLLTTMITSRGCPYRCLFCDRPHLGKRFRARSAKNVVDEMDTCIDMGIDEFLIYDDTFTIDRQRVIDICDMIIERNWDIGWDVRARVNTVDEELLGKMKDAGCERIHYGVESGNPEILRTLRKGITLKQAEEAFKMTKRVGIQTLAYFMIGSPGETKETIMQSIKFAKKLDADFVHFSITTPFPSTDLYHLGLREGILKTDYWRDFARNPSSDFVPEVWAENLPREELIELLSYAYRKFYTRPDYIMKRILRIKSFDEFKRKAKAGLKVFRM